MVMYVMFIRFIEIGSDHNDSLCICIVWNFSRKAASDIFLFTLEEITAIENLSIKLYSSF